MARNGSPLGEVALVAVTLYVSRLSEAIAWYREKLGLEPMALGNEEHPFASYAIGGSIVVLEPIEAALDPVPMGNDNTTLNILVDRDPVEVRAELLAKAVVCSDIVASSSYVSFLLRDPDGNRFYVAHAISRKSRQDTETAARVTGSGTKAG